MIPLFDFSKSGFPMQRPPLLYELPELMKEKIRAARKSYLEECGRLGKKLTEFQAQEAVFQIRHKYDDEMTPCWTFYWEDYSRNEQLSMLTDWGIADRDDLLKPAVRGEINIQLSIPEEDVPF